LLEALERERLFLAEELHEGLCQSLGALSIHLKALERRVKKMAPAIGNDFAELHRTVEEAIDQTRFLHRTLKPPVSDGPSFLKALTEWVESKRGVLECEASFHERIDSITPGVAVALLRIAQEALRDSILNPTVTATRVTLAVKNRSLMMTLSDDRKPSSGPRNAAALQVTAAHAKSIAGKVQALEKDATIEVRAPLAASPRRSARSKNF